MRMAWKPLVWGLLALLLLLLLTVLAGGLMARHLWVQALHENGIETLEWQGLGLSIDALKLQQLQIRQAIPGHRLEVQVQALQVHWRWLDHGWLPQLALVKAGQLELEWRPTPATTPASGRQAPAPVAGPPEIPIWWPAELVVERLDVTLPCRAGRCSLFGTLRAGWQGQRQLQHLQAEVELARPAAWLEQLPEPMRPEALTLSVRLAPSVPAIPPGSPLADTANSSGLLPLTVALRSHGGAKLVVESHLAITTSAPWAIQFGQTQADASLPALQAANWQLAEPRVRLAFTGWLDTAGMALTFDHSTWLAATELQPGPGGVAAKTDELRAKDLRLTLADATLNAAYRLPTPALAEFTLKELTLKGQVGLSMGQLSHPLLQAQAWDFDGRVASNLSAARLTGVLRANSGSMANLALDAPYNGSLRLDSELQVSGEEEAAALARVFAKWPPLLTLTGGRVSAEASLRKPPAKAAELTATLKVAEGSGLYDRTEWRGMNGRVEVELQQERLSFSTPGLVVEQLNPGLPLGPLRVEGRYQAHLAELGAGTLALAQASAGALGGEIRIPPGRWDLAQAPVTLPVHLQQLSLARLLQVYPAEGLAGTGILSGTLPVRFDPAAGIRVEQGRLEALAPGGRLQLTAERLQALASQNETMKLVARALEDFHYSVLDSGIDYNEDGTLLLTLQVKGRNPEVGQGRPVVLNVNLEENIPALLKSLQLSGNVSERVKQRVRDLLEKRQRDPDAG